MGVLQNSIGDTPDIYYFDDMSGSVELEKWAMGIWRRPGLAGNALRREFYSAEPFQLITRHYVADWLATYEAREAYQALITAGDPVTLWMHDVEVGKFYILNVQEIPGETRACINVVGSLVTNPQVRHVCAWTLVYASDFLGGP